MLEVIRHARDVHGFHLWAYTLMLEHVHLLIADFHGPENNQTLDGCQSQR